MSDFIFSVNVTFPIFLVMVIGWVLHQIGMLDEHFVTVANRFNFKVTLPFMLFRDIASVEISKVFDLKFVLYCAIVSSICFWGIWGISKFAVKDDSIRGAFVQSFVPKQCSRHGNGIYQQYLRIFCHGSADDRGSGSAVQCVFRYCTDI